MNKFVIYIDIVYLFLTFSLICSPMFTFLNLWSKYIGKYVGQFHAECAKQVVLTEVWSRECINALSGKKMAAIFVLWYSRHPGAEVVIRICHCDVKAEWETFLSIIGV